MKLNNPVVKLVSIGGHTPEVFSKVWIAAKDNTPYDQIKEMPMDKLDNCMSTDIPTQEYISTVWYIEGMPRAFWDQLDRCRLAAYWEQSGRVMDYSDFADIKHYWTPSRVSENPEAKRVYDNAMLLIQGHYAELVKMGVPAEEARGIIPLHILTRGTMCINLRALKGLIRNRVCFVCQGSYWLPIIEGMISELSPLLPPKTLRSLVSLPCGKGGNCPIEGNVLQRISGEDPNPVCPVYLELFAKEKEEVERKEERRIKNYKEIKERYLNLVSSLGLLEGGEKNDSQEGRKCGS